MSLGFRNHRFLACQGIILSSLLLFVLLPMVCRAQMSPVSEEELSNVSAQSGVTYVFGDSQIRVTEDSYRISDTDHTPHNWIEFNNITIGDGEGGYFSMDTPANYDDFNTLDVATDDQGRTFVFMNLSTHVEPRTYTIGEFVFCDQDLGSIMLENMRKGASDTLAIRARGDGMCGIDMEYRTELTLDSLEYSFRSHGGMLKLSGFHLAGNAIGAPEDPSSWIFLGKFKLGDFENENPLTIDVGSFDDGISTSTSVFYNIPMSGSMRVENVNFDGNQFGPCAIDGITVHHLGIQIPSN